MVKMPVRDADMETQEQYLAPSAYWGEEAIWDSHNSMHNPMMDERATFWFTSRVGKPTIRLSARRALIILCQGVPDQAVEPGIWPLYPKTGTTS